LIGLQANSVRRVGHRYAVISDRQLPGVETFVVDDLPSSLMKAILAGQLTYLKQQWSGDHHLVLADVDCLICRDLSPVFDGIFDLGLTRRADRVSPINNGAMYIAAGSKDKAVDFFTRCLDFCKDHWGGDQEAISRVAHPVPDVDGSVEVRHGGIRVKFLDCKMHNVAAKAQGVRHKKHPFVVHFKGEQAKAWMDTYSTLYLR
jgi:hypothetical protein